jgi:hypothetical protein
MREWLYQNREVLMVVLTAIIAVGVFLGPYLTEKVRRTNEALQQAETEARNYNEKASELLNAATQYVESLLCTG